MVRLFGLIHQLGDRQANQFGHPPLTFARWRGPVFLFPLLNGAPSDANGVRELLFSHAEALAPFPNSAMD